MLLNDGGVWTRGSGQGSTLAGLVDRGISHRQQRYSTLREEHDIQKGIAQSKRESPSLGFEPRTYRLSVTPEDQEIS